MHATINASRLPILRSRLTAGSIYTISEPVSPLPEEGFRFRNQAELVGLANTNTQLPGRFGSTTLLEARRFRSSTFGKNDISSARSFPRNFVSAKYYFEDIGSRTGIKVDGN
ncbi:hypothetical protein F2Q68_00005578 [Brassica cretica]|uniref:Uncharacterized protein n=1 Tax=Brassica cretica TaxID=69181 RepID=A0A8S9J812_BRACR|nr:hypothetical protein F2Q68_00005578 [Brassica cretica]